MNSAHSLRDRLVAEAAQAHRLGQLDDAERLGLEAVEVDPLGVSAHFILGVIYARKKDPIRASAMLEKVLEIDPNSFETLISLSAIYRESGRLSDATSLAERAIKVQPGDPQSFTNLGRCYLAARRLDEAAAAFQRAIQVQPRFSAASYHLGKTKQLQGKDGEAAAAFSRAAKLTPSLEHLLALGQSLLTVADFESALLCGLQCVRLFPESAPAHLLLAGALTEANRFEEATHHLNEAIDLDINGTEALQIAIRQRPLGFVTEANENLRKAIILNPGHISAYDALIHNSKVTDIDRDLISHLEELLRSEKLAPTELISVHYGLGKSKEDLGQFEDSMRHYDAANLLTREMKFGTRHFDENGYAQQVKRLIENIGAIKQPDMHSPTCKSSVPIFVLGMMRSGTTLAEQILSSHPKIKAAGEQLFWTLNAHRALSGSFETLVHLGEEYVQFLKSIDQGAERVTDKMPGNYMFAGLIHQALPNARIIHMRRLPVDNCLSIWATPNHMPHEGGHDKAAVAFVYKQYLKIMEHWRTVLPSNRLLEIDYEDLVSNPEIASRRMLSFCDLPWDDSCLRPEDNQRTVLTPSAWQVRQPVYRTSMERWRKFEPWLGEFREMLEQTHPTAR